MEDQLYWLSAIAYSSLSLGANKLFNNILLTLLFKKNFSMVILLDTFLFLETWFFFPLCKPPVSQNYRLLNPKCCSFRNESTLQRGYGLLRHMLKAGLKPELVPLSVSCCLTDGLIWTAKCQVLTVPPSGKERWEVKLVLSTVPSRPRLLSPLRFIYFMCMTVLSCMSEHCVCYAWCSRSVKA